MLLGLFGGSSYPPSGSTTNPPAEPADTEQSTQEPANTSPEEQTKSPGSGTPTAGAPTAQQPNAGSAPNRKIDDVAATAPRPAGDLDEPAGDEDWARRAAQANVDRERTMAWIAKIKRSDVSETLTLMRPEKASGGTGYEAAVSAYGETASIHRANPNEPPKAA